MMNRRLSMYLGAYFDRNSGYGVHSHLKGGHPFFFLQTGQPLPITRFEIDVFHSFLHQLQPAVAQHPAVDRAAWQGARLLGFKQQLSAVARAFQAIDHVLKVNAAFARQPVLFIHTVVIGNMCSDCQMPALFQSAIFACRKTASGVSDFTKTLARP